MIFIKLYALSLAIVCLAVSLNFLLSIPAVNVQQATFLIAIFIWLLSSNFSRTKWAKNILPLSDTDFSLKFKSIWLNYLLRLILFPFQPYSQLSCSKKMWIYNFFIKFITEKCLRLFSLTWRNNISCYISYWWNFWYDRCFTRHCFKLIPFLLAMIKCIIKHVLQYVINIIWI